MAYAARPLAERFWEKVSKDGDCWLWTASLTRGGYGQFPLRKGVIRRAHRIAWELENGPVPNGLWVLHRCDNPPCVRPSHLFLGTPKDNSADMTAKGRHNTPLGSARPAARLSEADVITIRAARANGETGAALARRYGVHRSSIYHICNRDYWKHI
jgi:hypothetical protein